MTLGEVTEDRRLAGLEQFIRHDTSKQHLRELRRRIAPMDLAEPTGLPDLHEVRLAVRVLARDAGCAQNYRDRLAAASIAAPGPGRGDLFCEAGVARR